MTGWRPFPDFAEAVHPDRQITAFLEEAVIPGRGEFRSRDLYLKEVAIGDAAMDRVRGEE